MHVALHKKLKNNVMPVGSTGTGKTKLVETFAAAHQIHNIYVMECAKLIGSPEYRPLTSSLIFIFTKSCTCISASYLL